jgi:hypothetical protein
MPEWTELQRTGEIDRRSDWQTRSKDPEYREQNRRRAAAYQRALRKLRERHPEEFRMLLEDERTADGKDWRAR